MNDVNFDSRLSFEWKSSKLLSTDHFVSRTLPNNGSHCQNGGRWSKNAKEQCCRAWNSRQKSCGRNFSILSTLITSVMRKNDSALNWALGFFLSIIPTTKFSKPKNCCYRRFSQILHVPQNDRTKIGSVSDSFYSMDGERQDLMLKPRKLQVQSLTRVHIIDHSIRDNALYIDIYVYLQIYI